MGHTPGVGLGGTQGVKKNWGGGGGGGHGHVAYQIEMDDEQNASKIFTLGQTGDHGVRSNIINFQIQN